MGYWGLKSHMKSVLLDGLYMIILLNAKLVR